MTWTAFPLKRETPSKRTTGRIASRRSIFGIDLKGQVEAKGRNPIHRNRFPAQETQVRRGDELHTRDGKLGDVVEMDTSTLTIDIKKTGKSAALHPRAAFVHDVVTARESA